MKAKILKTGEIVNIAEYAKITLDQCDSWGNPVEVKPEEVELIRDTPDYEAEFSEFRKDNPTWEKYLTDSTYYEMMSWYDGKHGLANKDDYSDEGRAFANYVWDNYVQDTDDHTKEWEQRRFLAAISAMEGMLANPALIDAGHDYMITIEKSAVAYADELIKQLKETSK